MELRVEHGTMVTPTAEVSIHVGIASCIQRTSTFRRIL